MTPSGPEDASLFDLLQEQQKSPVKVDMSQEMWDYKNRNVFEGIKVDPQAQNLLVNSTDELTRALQPKASAGVWTGYISPQEADKEYVKAYGELKQKEADGLIYILQEQTQFCPSINKFLILLTYINIELGLNPRYSHLKEGSNG